MSKLKSVSIFSWAEVRLFMSLIIALIIALIYLVIGLMFIVYGNVDRGISLIIFSIFLPLIVIIFSFFMGLIEGWVFNVAVNLVGGLEINIDGF